MNTPIEPNDQDTRPLIDKQRRRLSKVGLAAPVVLGTLLSRPVLGAAPYNCTISGQMSGNVSSHGEPVSCATLGLSPGYWKEHPNLWSPFLSTGLFKSVFANAYAFKIRNPTTTDIAPAGTNGWTPDPTLLHVLQSRGGLRPNLNYPSLGRAAVASWLNAYHRPNYPLTQAEVIAMFNAVYNGGNYYVNASVHWDASQVMTYFESLYS
ncbi:MAG: hypothetical protein GC183_02135 [Thiobacillus sp.]|nr:hypothetical protein [Thiobacillus sp.]